VPSVDGSEPEQRIQYDRTTNFAVTLPSTPADQGRTTANCHERVFAGGGHARIGAKPAEPGFTRLGKRAVVSSILTGGSSFDAGQSVIRPPSDPFWAHFVHTLRRTPARPHRGRCRTGRRTRPVAELALHHQHVGSRTDRKAGAVIVFENCRDLLATMPRWPSPRAGVAIAPLQLKNFQPSGAATPWRRGNSRSS
jgi:hypothetical protein